MRRRRFGLLPIWRSAISNTYINLMEAPESRFDGDKEVVRDFFILGRPWMK